MNSTSTPLLLASWSVTTTATQRFSYYNSQSYTDTPKSRYEAHNVAVIRKSGQLRRDAAAQLRTLDRLEALDGAA